MIDEDDTCWYYGIMVSLNTDIISNNKYDNMRSYNITLYIIYLIREWQQSLFAFFQLWHPVLED